MVRWRVSADRMHFDVNKDHDPVEPCLQIDLAEHVLSGDSAKYAIVGFIAHIGSSPHNGHYTYWERNAGGKNDLLRHLALLL